MRHSPRAAASLVLLPVISLAFVEVQALPRVRMIATGGTISTKIGGGRLTGTELLTATPGLERYVRAEVEQFSNVSSTQLTLDQWLQLSRRLNELFKADAEVAGLVVTSGTDTLEELAYFLNLTVRDERPVVVVGSMRSSNEPGSEGAANLLAAFRVAADPQSHGKGVLVVLNEEINAARDVIKTDGLLPSTFQSRGVGVLGFVDRDYVVYHRAPVKRHTAATEFDVAKIEHLPRVDVILTYQDAAGDLIEAAAERGAKGIVIAGAGGSTSGTQFEAVRAALKKGVIVVATIRSGGRFPARRGPRPAPPPNLDPSLFNRISGEDLQPAKARILLMLALTKTNNPDEIQRMFNEY